MTRRRDLTPEDRAVWRRVAKTVSPREGRKLPDPEPVSKSAGAPASKPKPQRPAAAPAPKAAPPRPPGPADVSGEKRVRRGRIEVEGRIDLHGLNQDQARADLLDFIVRARAQEKRTLLIITGKGKSGEGVIRRRFPDWLASPDFSAHVSGYAPAHVRHGGGGAFYVRVRRKES